MRKIGILMLLGLAWTFQVQAQETWSLQKCIDHALAHNISIKQYEVNTQFRENNLQQAKNNRLPDASANISQSYSFGRSLALNNTYENSRSANTGLNASTSVMVYRGHILQNTIKQQEFLLKSNLETLQKAKDDVKLNVASNYLEVLFAKEILRVAEAQVTQTQQQLDRTKHLIEAGKVAAGVKLEMESQLAREELTVVNSQNNLQIALLNLSQLLELEDYTNFDIETPTIPELKAEATVANATTVFSNAAQNRPEIKSAEYQLQSSEVQLKISKAGNIPTVSASAGIFDQYLTNSSYTTPSFIDQLSGNHRESLGLNVSIPIFNRFQTKTDIANSKLQIENDRLELERTKKDLRKQIEQVQTSAVAAHKRFLSNRTAVMSMQESFRYVEEKFNAGRVTSVEYNDAKTKLGVAQSELIQAKYEFIFRTKILDFYNGIPIAL
jgi:outer membrane protein